MLRKDFLYLSDETTPAYQVHPVVIFSILDHYKRRNQDTSRVIGALLGVKSGKNVEITNCFPVPHLEKQETVVLDMDYFDTMLGLHKRANAQEVVVGWYSTGNEVSYISSCIHSAFSSIVEDVKPLLLTVDVTLANAQMELKAYTGTNLTLGDHDVVARFDPVNIELKAYDTEKIGVDALITSQPDDTQRLDSPATIYTEFDNLEDSMTRLLQLFEKVGDYVKRVQAGEVKGDVQLGTDLLDALASIPKMSKAEFSKMFNKNIQDLLMVVYLANLTRLQLGVADRINGLLP